MNGRPGSAAAAGAVLALLVDAVLHRANLGEVTRWQRPNHRGASVSLLSGPALAVAATATSGLPPAAAAAAGLGAAAIGRYDDAVGGAGGVGGAAGARGLRGHGAALRQGRVTTGSVKVLGVGGAGLLASVLLPGRRPVADVVLDAGLVAGAANLVNLFDLRPGRALKVVVLGSAVLGLPGPAGAAAALLPADLREHSMLGDAGANAHGALLGLAVACRVRSRRRRTAVLGALVALTAASEVVSFSRVIDACPPLRWLDRLGRLP